MKGQAHQQGLAPSFVVPGPLAHTTSRKKLKPYRVRAYHDDCGGELIGTEHGETVIGPERGFKVGSAPWKHICKKCGAVGWVKGVNYPAIAYED